MTPELAADAGYEVATTRAELDALPEDAEFVSGQFAPDHMPYEYDAIQADTDPYEVIPHLHEMVSDALDRLEDNPEGFFLLVEGGRIDHGGHENYRQHRLLHRHHLGPLTGALARSPCPERSLVLGVESE